MTLLFTHHDPADRLEPANARLSIMHSFEVVFDDHSERDHCLTFLDGQCDIWLDRGLGLNSDGSVGTKPTARGREPFFKVETPRADLAMLFKLMFGGDA